MNPKSLYLPVFILAFLLASEMPRVHGLFGLINHAGEGVTNLLRGTAGVIDAVLKKPNRRRPSNLLYKPQLTLLNLYSMEIGDESGESLTSEKSSRKHKEKSSSKANNKSKRGDNKNSGGKNSSIDITIEDKEKSSSTANNKSKSGDNKNSGEKNSSIDISIEDKEKRASTKDNKSASGDNKNSGAKDSSTDTTDENKVKSSSTNKKKISSKKCKCKRKSKYIEITEI
ncbi:dentin sialophosphoprotein [Zeugodacus cucurbitae]|uniref:dentin sialophosphoprotein n=1 Tax=Zeugodacus cucurbitae TaxID=28588 RepID=UPI0023D8F84F|nr:dentin sialophosphoprotein [Zeugodacus cucurbitae]